MRLRSTAPRTDAVSAMRLQLHSSRRSAPRNRGLAPFATFWWWQSAFRVCRLAQVVRPRRGSWYRWCAV